MLLSALSTVDPGDILASVKAARQHRVRVSVVGLSAQLHVCELLTKVREHALCLHQTVASLVRPCTMGASSVDLLVKLLVH